MSEETIPQMRETIESLQKANKGLTKERDELAKDNRRLQARDVARDQGLPASRGDLYAAQNSDGEITAEGLMEFVDSFDLAVSEVSEDDEEASDEGGEDTQSSGSGNENLAGMSRSGSRAGDGPTGGAETQKMTRQEWKELHSTDPEAAKAAAASGRVELSEGNPHGPTQGVSRVRGDNPYARSSA